MNEPKRLSNEREAEIRKWTAKDVDHCYFCVELLAELDRVRGELKEEKETFVRMENAWRNKCDLATYGRTKTTVHPEFHKQAIDTLKSELEAVKRERDAFRAFTAKVKNSSTCAASVLVATQVLEGHDVRDIEHDQLREKLRVAWECVGKAIADLNVATEDGKDRPITVMPVYAALNRLRDLFAKIGDVG